VMQRAAYQSSRAYELTQPRNTKLELERARANSSWSARQSTPQREWELWIPAHRARESAGVEHRRNGQRQSK